MTDTKKPAAKKPVAKKPAAKKPVAKKPAATKPVAKKPAAKKPVAKSVKKGGSPDTRLPQALGVRLPEHPINLPYYHQSGRTPAPGSSQLVQDCVQFKLNQTARVEAYINEKIEELRAEFAEEGEELDVDEELRAEVYHVIEEEYQAACLSMRRNGQLTNESMAKARNQRMPR